MHSHAFAVFYRLPYYVSEDLSLCCLLSASKGTSIFHVTDDFFFFEGVDYRSYCLNDESERGMLSLLSS